MLAVTIVCTRPRFRFRTEVLKCLRMKLDKRGARQSSQTATFSQTSTYRSLSNQRVQCCILIANVT